jgi:hypothetical protein
MAQVVICQPVNIEILVKSQASAVAYWGEGGSNPYHPPKFHSFDKAELNSQFCGKYILNNPIRIWVSLFCKLSGTPDKGATAPRSPFSLSTKFVEPPPPNKIPGYATGPVDKMAQAQVSLQVLQFSPVSITPSAHLTHSFICH